MCHQCSGNIRKICLLLWGWQNVFLLYFMHELIGSVFFRVSLQRKFGAARLPKKMIPRSLEKHSESLSCTLASHHQRNWWRTTPAAAGRPTCPAKDSSTSASTTWPSIPSCWGRKVCTPKWGMLFSSKGFISLSGLSVEFQNLYCKDLPTLYFDLKIYLLRSHIKYNHSFTTNVLI